MHNSNDATGQKVFIVDDSPIIVERLYRMMEELEQISVIGNAHNISDSLIAIESLQPDAVILDIHLAENAPETNGIDLLRILRDDYPSMRILMLTNLSGKEYRNKCMELGANYFLDKTNDFHKIQEILAVIKS
jgi:DNA-binding NarL/FixJ family response regulator